MRSILALLLCLPACTKETTPAAKPVAKATYGRVADGPAVTPAEVMRRLDELDGKTVRIEGTVAAVCQHRGCWMDIAGTDGTTIRIKVKDGEVVFPKTAKGKRVIAEGIVVKIPADPADDKTSCGGGEGHAEESGEHHDCSRPAGASARLDGTGAIVFEG